MKLYTRPLRRSDWCNYVSDYQCILKHKYNSPVSETSLRFSFIIITLLHIPVHFHLICFRPDLKWKIYFQSLADNWACSFDLANAWRSDHDRMTQYAGYYTQIRSNVCVRVQQNAHIPSLKRMFNWEKRFVKLLSWRYGSFRRTTQRLGITFPCVFQLLLI